MKLFHIFEYGKIRCEGESSSGDFPQDLLIPKDDFNDIWDFVLEQHSLNNDSSYICKLYTRQGRRVIQATNYVGTLETARNTAIEILPKIYKVNSYKESKAIFLKMLSSLPDTPFRSFQFANVDSMSNFPVLEIFISQYINLLEIILKGGLKKDYVRVKHQSKYIKGQLNFHENLRNNLIDKTKFNVSSHLYIDDIPLNRIVHSTLVKLLNISSDANNIISIRSLLRNYSNVPISSNVEKDLIPLSHLSRLYKPYETIVEWSSVFLHDKGFINFSGAHLNKALLYPMQELFESFVASLFKKYATSHTVHTQHKKYFLIDRHNGSPRFQLRPDIVLTSDYDLETVILDTKWKIIDENKSSKKDNYNIDIADMYQLYAYGKKYSLGSTLEPRLFLIYPQTNTFTQTISPFFYEEKNGAFHLRLEAIPFDLSDSNNYELQIKNIVNHIENS